MVEVPKADLPPNNTDLSTDAIITLHFSRLWDLLSTNQRQYALYLHDSRRYQSLTDTPSKYTGLSWSALPSSLRVSVLNSFKKLPGVFRVTGS